MPETNLRPAATSKTDRVYEYVLSRHTRGEYGSGQRIVISQIADEVGVSPVPVREALSRLHADGIVEYEHQKGFRIRSVDPESVYSALQAHAIIEAAAIGLAAATLTSADIAELRARNDAIDVTIADFNPRGFVDASNSFHQFLLDHSPNRYLVDMLLHGPLHPTALRAASAVLAPARARTVVSEHEELLSLIESGADAAAVEGLARRHRLRTAENYRAAFDGDPDPSPAALPRESGAAR